MKILILNHNIMGNGTYLRCFNFAKNLTSFGHTVTILTSIPDFTFKLRKKVINGVKVICMPDIISKRYRNGGLGIIDTYLRCLYVMNRKFDVVENFDHRPAVLYPTIIAKYFKKIPVISEWTDLHGSGGSLNLRARWLQKLIGGYENFTERKSKKIGRKLVVISLGLKEKALQLGIPESNIEYIPGGADIDNIYPQEKKHIRKNFGLPLEKKIIAYTAGTHYDVDLLLNSINIIQKTMKDVILVTTGGKFKKVDFNNILEKQKVVELGFLDYERYAQFLPAADIFLFPYANQEINRCRWPNKIGDYMAAGRPIITNKTGDLISLYKKHEIGILCNDDPKDLAKKTIEIMSNSELRKKMGETARITAEKYYDWKILSKKLENIFIKETTTL